MNLQRLQRRLAFAAAFAMAACATASAPGGVLPPPPPETPIATLALEFALPAPEPEALADPMKLWATHYHTPLVTPAPPELSAAFPLINRKNQSISPMLRHRDWCEAALQGSVSVIDASGQATAYVFVDSKGPEQANCDQWLGKLSDGVKRATRRARFMAVDHPFGCGVRSIPLMPFRTLAVDPNVIPIGSVVFVPELRGRTFNFSGRDLVHDGYLFAGDRGGAIKGVHVDVFHGPYQGSPFEDLFASHAGRTFDAHIVAKDQPAAQAVVGAQDGHCGELPA